jgi:hypothetical protein
MDRDIPPFYALGSENSPPLDSSYFFVVLFLKLFFRLLYRGLLGLSLPRLVDAHSSSYMFCMVLGSCR